MENCFIHKLDVDSNNPSLKKLGYLRLHVSSGKTSVENRRISLTSPDLIVSVADGTKKISTSSDLSSPVSEYKEKNAQYRILYFLEGDYDVDIYSKYDISYFSDAGNLSVTGRKISINIDEFEFNDKLTSITMQTSADTTGNIASLANAKDLSNIKLSNSQVEGDIYNIRLLTKLTNLLLYYSNVNGSIENFAKGQSKEGGRTSGSIEVSCSNTNIRYNQKAVSGAITITFSNSGCTVSGTSVKTGTYNKSSDTWSYS